MPRPKRVLLDHSCYHITHRCHNREFLLKFSKHRDLYLTQLRIARKRAKISILNYVITGNHVHLLVWTRKGPRIPKFMQFLQGEFAQQYNRLKDRQGGFWQNRYHTTLIQDGDHLSRCLFYIDFNMVRAGVGDHPGAWKHSGYHELAGERHRYRVLDRDRLIRCLGTVESQFSDWYIDTTNQKAKETGHSREAYWSEALAVGSKSWLESCAEKISKRKQIVPADSSLQDTTTEQINALAEEHEPYYLKSR